MKTKPMKAMAANNATSAAAQALALALALTLTSASQLTLQPALAACCVNSFLISAYHFISTFQRNVQCAGLSGLPCPCPCPGRGLQAAAGGFQVQVKVVSPPQKCSVMLRSACPKECQLQLPGSQFMKMPNHTRPRKSRLHKQQMPLVGEGAGAGNVAGTQRETAKERDVCFWENWRSLGDWRQCLNILVRRQLPLYLPSSLSRTVSCFYPISCVGYNWPCLMHGCRHVCPIA